MMIRQIVIGALDTVTKGLVQTLEELEITGRMMTVQTTALLRSARILRRVLETWGDFCHSNSSGKLPVNADAKNSKGEKNNHNNIDDNNVCLGQSWKNW